LYLAEESLHLHRPYFYQDYGKFSITGESSIRSWSLLVIVTFPIVANLKHIRKRIDVPK
jgi:uncharacterized membrane protein YoaT (DUF817 family)